MTVMKGHSNDGTHVRQHEERRRCDMHLLVQVLEQTEHLAGLLEGFAKAGVTGTTVLDSIGLGRILLESGVDVPPLPIIRDVLAKGKFTNKTLFAIVRDEDTLRPTRSGSRSPLCF